MKESQLKVGQGFQSATFGMKTKPTNTGITQKPLIADHQVTVIKQEGTPGETSFQQPFAQLPLSLAAPSGQTPVTGLGKIRKSSAANRALQQTQIAQLDPATLAMMKQHLGGLANADYHSSGKERNVRKYSNHSSKGPYQKGFEGAKIATAGVEFARTAQLMQSASGQEFNKLQAKRNSKLLMSQNEAALNFTPLLVGGQQRNIGRQQPSTSDSGVPAFIYENPQKTISQQQHIVKNKYGKSRLQKSNTTNMTVQLNNIYRANSTVGTEQQQQLANKDDSLLIDEGPPVANEQINLNYFSQNAVKQKRVQNNSKEIIEMLEDAKVEDYNDSQNFQNNLYSKQNFNEIRQIPSLADYGAISYPREHSNQNLDDNLHDYYDQYDIGEAQKEACFDHQEFQEPKDQFYMTQVLNPSQLRNAKSNNTTQMMNSDKIKIPSSQIASLSSGNLKIQRSSKLKSSTKRLANNKISTQYATSAAGTIKSLSALAMQNQLSKINANSNEKAHSNLKNFGCNNSSDLNQQMPISQQNVKFPIASSAMMKSTGLVHSIQKRSSIANSTQNCGQSMLAGEKDYFNATAPINMHKINQLLMGQPTSGQNDLEQDSSIKAYGRTGFASSYYTGIQMGNHAQQRHSLGSVLQSQNNSISPIKLNAAEKKQMLIKSILNQDYQQNALIEGDIQAQQIQQFIQSKEDIAEFLKKSTDFASQKQTQSINQKRLNKTLDSIKQKDSGGSYPHLKDYHTAINSKAKQTKAHYNPEGRLSAAGSSYAIWPIQISEFNHTQQFTDLKGCLSSLGVAQPLYKPQQPETALIEQQQQQYMIMNRKKKSSIRSTNNLQINPQKIPEEQKVSALSNYTTNVAQSTQNNKHKLMHHTKSASKKGTLWLSNLMQKPQQNNSSQNLQDHYQKDAHKNQGKAYSQHRKQGSQCNTESDKLKLMMNFYQDDFLKEFQLKNNGGAFNNNRMSLNLISKKGQGNEQGIGAMIQESLKQYQTSKSASKTQSLANKHKANSTLNHYLIQTIKPQQSKAQTALKIHQTPFNIEPLLVTSTNKSKPVIQDDSNENDLATVNPYNYLKLQGDNNRKSSAQKFKNAETSKDFQNKTQPIPRSILDIGQQVGAAMQVPVNLSTGTSLIMGDVRNFSKQTSSGNKQIQIKGGNQNSEPQDSLKGMIEISKPIKAFKNSNMNATEEKQQAKIKNPEMQLNKLENKTQNAKLSEKQSAIPINIEKTQKNKLAKIEDPAEVYQNKKTNILGDTFDEDEAKKQNTSVSSDNVHQGTNENDKDNSDDEGDCSSCSSDGNEKLSRFIFGKQIGQGAYAVVRIVTNKKDNKKYAIKIYDKSKLTDINRQRSVRREIKLLQKMSHPNIVKIYEAFETDDNVYLVMEYVGGGSLHSYIREQHNRRLEENDAKRIFKQILTALQYCHKKSIAHRDIKLENILLDEDNNVKLIDFGFSTCIPNDKKIKMFCGTPSYMAPEIVLKQEYAGPPADIWASAVLLYALINGCFPFRGATDKELYRRIQRGTFVLHNQTVSNEFIDFLSKMLNTDADERPSADELLTDVWFQNDSAIQNKTHAEQIADQKRLFKAKILGKIPVEKTKNTICLNATSDNPLKNRTQTQHINDQGIENLPNTQGEVVSDFSDYGLQSQNAMKRLNQEAYQAYYNTSGANIGGSNGNCPIQNPYYNNFFQNNFLGNPQNHQTNVPAFNNGGNMGFYSNCFQNNQNIRISPSKHQPQANPQFTFQHQNHQATPQVFGSPTGAAFHCSGSLINNNFNIINNIIMNPQAILSSQPSSAAGGVTQTGACLSPGLQPGRNGSTNQDPQPISPAIESITTPPNNNIQIVQVEQLYPPPLDNDIDDEIVDSIAKMGFTRSQVVNQLMSSDENEQSTTQIGQLYSKLKEEKFSKTSKQNRAFSQHLQHHGGKNLHNYAIYPNFVPSIPNDGSIGSHNKEEETQKVSGAITLKNHNAYMDEINNDYNILVVSPPPLQGNAPYQKSPKIKYSRGTASNKNRQPCSQQVMQKLNIS